eukprot:Amastigsp_a843791_816.p3 type:complete len:119 gc:universal Amastigsp_a843791_816:378-22(-)
MVCDKERHGVAFGPLGYAHDRLEGPREEIGSRAHVPELGGVVCRAREQALRVRVDGAVPDRTRVPLVCAQTLAVVCKPHHGVVVLGRRENEITLSAVADVRESTGVPLQHDRAHSLAD